jgi:hypothetical protein
MRRLGIEDVARQFVVARSEATKQSRGRGRQTLDCLAKTYFFALRFFAVRFFAVFFGTFAPAARASESPIAIACLRLLTLRPERPLFSVPALRFFIARPTLAAAFFAYFRAMNILPVVAR